MRGVTSGASIKRAGMLLRRLTSNQHELDRELAEQHHGGEAASRVKCKVEDKMASHHALHPAIDLVGTAGVQVAHVALAVSTPRGEQLHRTLHLLERSKLLESLHPHLTMQEGLQRCTEGSGR